VIVATASGRVHSGSLRGDSAGAVVLAESAAKEVCITRDEVDEMLPGTVSVMPAGPDERISRQELADLLESLKARK
jgi:hypothetical protein